MRAVGIGAILCLLMAASAKPGTCQTRVGDISLGTAYRFKSAFLEGDIPVSIHLPRTPPSGQARHPVLYMLDIANDFAFGAAAADFLAACGRVPGLIVVAIDVDRLSGPPQAMIDFLEKELIPYVERTHPASPRRLLYGHSGRSFAATFIMLTRPELFDAAICAGFGLTWPVEAGRADFSAMAANRFAKVTSFPKTFVFSLGDEPRFYAGVEHFREVLTAKAPPDFRWTYLHFPGDDHASTKLKTLYQGLEFVFGAPKGAGASR